MQNIANADATINIYLKHPVGIGEHPQHLEELDKLVGTIAENREKLEVLEDFLMVDLELISKIQRQLKQLYVNISDSMMAGNIDNMEKYKYMLGQAHAYQYISQEISNLLNKKEQKNEQGTVIDLSKPKERGPKA